MEKIKKKKRKKEKKKKNFLYYIIIQLKLKKQILEMLKKYHLKKLKLSLL